MEIRAFGDHVILEPLEPLEKIGGIFLPIENQEQMRQRAVAMIASLGPRVNTERATSGEEPLEVGQIVAYWKNKAGIVQGLDLKHLIYCHMDGLIGLVSSDRHASASDVKAARERSEKLEKEREERAARESSERGMGPGLLVPGMPMQGPRLSQ